MRRLVILEEHSPPREVVTELDDDLVIGRDPASSIVLGSRSVSRQHAVIRRHGGEVLLEDSGSTFGTFINDQPLAPQSPVALRDGDVIRLGQVRLICRFEPEPADLDAAVREAAFAAQANARLLLLEGELVRRRPVAGAQTLIGSAPHCEVRLCDRTAPDEQALIRAAGGGFFVQPRSRSHPLRLNETQEVVTECVALPSSSVLLLHGGTQALFLYDFGEEGRPVDDPLRRIPRRRLLRRAAERTDQSYRSLAKFCRGRRGLGQGLGEILVEQGLAAPLFWRTVSNRLLEDERGRRRWLPWRNRI